MPAEAKRGRPPVEEKAAFRNVAVPMEIYEMIRDLSKAEERTDGSRWLSFAPSTISARNLPILKLLYFDIKCTKRLKAGQIFANKVSLKYRKSYHINFNNRLSEI